MINNHNKTTQLDLTAIRERLKNSTGKKFWRSLEEVAETPEFIELLHNEFPQGAVEFSNQVNRRNFLKLMGASLALAGVNACTRQPEEKIVPYVQQPEMLVPGKPLFYATAMTMSGLAKGILVESHMGRPTKVEGNPDHPMSLGAADAFAQASVLGLYDPDRSQVISKAGRISTWETFLSEVTTALEAQKAGQGAGLRILTETITSPTLAHQLNQIQSQFPNAKWHQYEPAGRNNSRVGSKLAFGEFVETQYRFENADVILSLDSDFLIDHPASILHSKKFSSRRQIKGNPGKMNRLYVVESTPSLTGTMADHRLSMPASAIQSFAMAVAKEVGATTKREQVSEAHSQWLAALVSDLKKNSGRSAVIAGEHQPPAVHTLAHALNHALGNLGQTVFYTDSPEANPVDQTDSLRELVNDMQNGSVDLLLVAGGNPVYDAPADLNFSGQMSQVDLRIHLGLYEDETSQLCHWHIPQTHFLETWSDARAADGTVTIMQPLIAPLYGGKSAHEVFAVFGEESGKSSHDIVREYWQSQQPAADFETFSEKLGISDWQQSLHDGMVANTALPNKSVALNLDESILTTETKNADSLEIIFRPDPTVWDGRFANNGWLQELPKPFTRLTWDNAALISVALAERMGLANEDVVEIKSNGNNIKAPVWIVPGQPENSITLHLGYGRTHAGKIGSRTGFNAYQLHTSNAPWFASGVEIKKTGERFQLASTQLHHSMENRHLVRAGTIEQYLEHPEFVHEMGHDPAPDMTLYPEHKYDGYSWGMAVDLNACTGCSACVTACQAENNIPIVGKTEVARGREMHWIRIDRYYEGDLDHPETYQQPVMCMHCENAPCEVVCPVAATTHSSEGLNEMVYNRCVGTRYCANNCPYKVRRFNFFKYADYETPSLKLLNNPDVTVRSRGVMEKCSYCVQRISAARIEAKKEEREIRDGEVVAACQQTCPADAIAFGNINDPESRVSKLKASKRNYGLLTDLNTRPRTTYLAKIKNPNPELIGKG